MSQQLKRKGNAAAPAAKQEKKAKDVAAETPSPALVQQVFDQVETIMGDMDKVEQKMEEEIMAIHAKHWPAKAAVFAKRNQALNKLPNFWRDAFDHHPTLSQLINETDKAILQYCTAVDSDESDPSTGFTLIFSFKPNKYFSSEKLSLTVTPASEEKEFAIVPSPIQWKDAKASADEDSILVSLFKSAEAAMEMKFAIDLIQDMVHDPISAYSGEMPGQHDDDDDDDDEDANGDDDEDDE